MSATNIIVNDETPRRQYVAAASQTNFDFPFPLFAAGDLQVYLTPAGNVADDTADLLTLTTDYTVTGTDTQDSAVVVLNTGATAGDIITIIRVVDIARTSDYQIAGDLLAETINREQDTEIMIHQQLRADIDRSIRLPITSTVSLDPIPDLEAGQYLRINDTATGFELNAGTNANQAAAVETQTLASGQTSVVFTSAVSPAAFYISGPDVDAGRLTLGDDYTVTTATKTVTLTQSYPAGTKLVMVYVDGAADLYSVSAGEVSYAPSGTGAVTTTVESKLRETVSVKDFGAVGDGVTDDSVAIDAALAHCRSTNQTLYFPKGDYYMTTPTTVGAAVSILGESERNTQIKPDFATFAYVFEFNTTNVVSQRISNLSIYGPTQYDTLNGGIKADPAYVMRFDHLRLRNLTNPLYLLDSWGTHLSNIRMSYVDDPITMGIPNGSSIRDVYIQRFTGNGIKMIDGLSPKLDNIILEYGVSSATGIYLQATHSAIVENVYTEGDMGTDILISFKNQRACLNTTINGCWFNSAATSIIKATSYRGLEIDNIVMQTPVATKLIDFTGRTYYDSPVYVGYVCQVDQNANGFIGDVRDTGQTLIPLSTDNRSIILTKPHPSRGDYTDADLNNIANYTVFDASGWYPYYKGSIYQGDQSLWNKGYTGYFVDRTIDRFPVYSKEPCTAQIQASFIATESVGNCGYLMRVRNLTNGYDADQSGFSGQGTTGGAAIQFTGTIPLEPGENDVYLYLIRTANDGGTTTLSETSVSMRDY